MIIAFQFIFPYLLNNLKFDTFRDTVGGGPVHWIKENYQCPNCFKDKENSCCKNKEQGNFCKADSVDMAQDNNVETFLNTYYSLA